MRGSKRKRREGVWEVRVYLGRDPVTGQERSLSKTVHGSAKAADEVLRDLLDKQAPSTDGLGVTFGQLLDRWLEQCERLDHSPTTLRAYRSQVEQTIRPALGKIPLTRLIGVSRSTLVRHLAGCEATGGTVSASATPDEDLGEPPRTDVMKPPRSSRVTGPSRAGAVQRVTLLPVTGGFTCSASVRPPNLLTS